MKMSYATTTLTPTDLTSRVRSALARHVYMNLNLDAHDGLPRAELARRCEAVAALADDTTLHASAARLGEVYRKMAEEDAAWTRRSSDELSRMPALAAAYYWCFLLRDCDRTYVNASSLPGQVFVGASSLDADPMTELEKLGWEAVPALVAMTADPRPTRSLSTLTRSGTSRWLNSNGTLSLWVLERITGEPLALGSSGDALSWDGGRTPTKAVEAWWKEARQLAPEEYFLRQLDSAPSENARETAARRLLALNPKRFALRLWEKVDASEGEQRLSVLRALGEHVLPSDQRRLAACLGDRNPAVLLSAARLLRDRCRDYSGVEAVMRRLASGSLDDACETCLFVGLATKFVAESQLDTLVTSYCELLKCQDVRVRRAAVRSSPLFPHLTLVDALLLMLNEWFEVGWTESYNVIRWRNLAAGNDRLEAGGMKSSNVIRWRDLAARALATMTEYPAGFDLHVPVASRDARITALKEWVRNRRTEFDWRALRRSALE